MLKISAKVATILLFGAFFISACATRVPPIQEVKAPEWVLKGTGAFESQDTKVFYGLGSAHGIKDPSLLRTTAENRARNEIAKIFQVYTSSLMKDYRASTSARDADAVSEEHHTEEAIKTVTSMTLSGVKIIDYWQNPKTGELFTLARLDLEEFKNSLEKAKELNAKVKEQIIRNADRLHEELSKEEALQR